MEPLIPLYLPGSRRLYEYERDGEQQLIAAELRRTLGAIAAAAPARIASGRSTQAEAEAVMFLWLAITEDVEALPSEAPDARCRELRAKNGIAWADKVEALSREVRARRDRFEADVAKGRLTRDQAQQQLERLEAVHDLYWRHGYAFDGTRDELRALTPQILDQDVAEQGAAVVAPVREHRQHATAT